MVAFRTGQFHLPMASEFSRRLQRAQQLRARFGAGCVGSGHALRRLADESDDGSAGGRGECGRERAQSDAGTGGLCQRRCGQESQPGAEPYLARLEYHKVIPLSDDTIDVERSPLSILTQFAVRRLDIRIGKFDLADFFDLNAVANSSHSDFMNWTVVNNGAWDYAADTRGYTYGGVIDYEDRWWGLQFAEALISKRANGLILQKNLQDAHSENYELELRPSLMEKRSTNIRLLAYTNFANMGDYHEAIDLFEAGKTPEPEISDHRMQNDLKYGFGINADQEFTDDIRGFVRAGWNEGDHESFNYTEVNETVAFGGDVRGTLWDRPRDRFGVAFVGNGISHRHQQYLALGDSVSCWVTAASLTDPRKSWRATTASRFRCTADSSARWMFNTSTTQATTATAGQWSSRECGCTLSYRKSKLA